MTGDFAHIRGSDALPEALRGAVVAIGNFDGVHRGHRAVLDRALAEARRLGVPTLVLTFDPHPRILFRPDIPLFRLTSPAMKARLLEACGFDGMVEQTFDIDFASLTAEEFVAKILVERLGIAHAVTGFDFHFGKARGGGPAFLMEAGGRHGFGVTLVDAFRDEGAEIVSSSWIRELLAEGEVAEAAGLLGYRFAVEAEIVGGQKLGRTLGYPTANMVLSPDNHLAHGIYAVRMKRADGSLHDGVASFGRRPTVSDYGAPLLETFLFDFSGDLYGETCQVGFFARLRGEEKFDGLDALTAQMKKDEAEARAVMEKTQPVGELDAALHFAAL
jgi:riboflavin kinase/FMN adenylyltransferase